MVISVFTGRHIYGILRFMKQAKNVMESSTLLGDAGD